MKASRSFALGLAPLLVAGIAHAQAPSPPYTQTQAQAGATLYTQNCAMCHGDATPGQTLVSPGSAPLIGGIFMIMTTNMPLNRPGQLSHTQYEDIMAYALQQNGYPAGSQPLDYAKTLASSEPFVKKKP